MNHKWKIVGLIIIIILCAIVASKKTIEGYNLDTKDLMFLHIPKNAGSSIEADALAHGYNWGKHDHRLKNQNNNKNCSFWHKHPLDLNENVYKNNNTFVVVRNPFERIVSEYNYVCKNNKKTPNRDELNQFVKTNLLITNNKKYDCHFIPQNDYIKAADVNNILYFENLESDFKKLSKKYNLGFNLSKKSNVSSNINGHVNSNDLNTESRNLIKNYYSDDFKYLNYNA